MNRYFRLFLGVSFIAIVTILSRGGVLAYTECTPYCYKVGSACKRLCRDCWTETGGYLHCTSYYYTGSCNCAICNTCPPPPCSPGACRGCTPATPAGYTATNNSCPVTTTRTCTGTNGCSSCTLSKTFWLIPTECSGCTIATPEGYTETDNGSEDTITRSCTGTDGCESCEITQTFYLINEDPEVDVDGDPRDDILPEVGGSDSTSLRGCYAEEYTGTEVNNPLHIRIPASDENGNEQIEAVIVWFSRSGSMDPVADFSATYEGTDTDEVAVMIMQSGGSWSSQNIYGLNADGTWALVGDGVLRNSSGDSIAQIHNIAITEGDDFAFDFDMELTPNDNNQMSGNYDFYATILDEYMLEDGNVPQSNIQNYFSWGVDLEEPTLDSLNKKVVDPQELYLNWEVNGTGTNITDVVLNAYRAGSLIVDTSNISLENPTGFDDLTLEDEPSEDLIGHWDDTNSWRYEDLDISPYIDNDNTKINIGLNDGGSIPIYVTAFDQGCNDVLGSESVDLNSWIATKGGVVYSSGSLGSGIKDVSEVLNFGDVLENLTKEELDLGTELASSRSDYIADLIHPDLGAVRASNTYDSNDRKDFWYNYFDQKLSERISGLESFAEITNSVSTDCPDGENCVMRSSEDITIPRDYVCDKKALFMTDGDITINPDVTSSGLGLEGCIFLAKNDIIIEEGTYKSTGDVIEYDYIEGFFMAGNQIHIKAGDAAEALKDGLEVYGSMLAFGRDVSDSNAILLNRNLRLFNSSNPALVLTWRPKYAKLSEVFFGTESPMYKQEVGFKAY